MIVWIIPGCWLRKFDVTFDIPTYSSDGFCIGWQAQTAAPIVYSISSNIKYAVPSKSDRHVPIAINPVNGPVFRIAVKVQALWITKFGIRNSRGLGGPIWAHEASNGI